MSLSGRVPLVVAWSLLPGVPWALTKALLSGIPLVWTWYLFSEGTWVVTRSLQADKHKRRNTTDRDVKVDDHEWLGLWRGREDWKKFYSSIINFNFTKYKLTSTKGIPESKDLVTNRWTPGSRDQVPTKGAWPGCQSYHKTEESYYNLRLLVFVVLLNQYFKKSFYVIWVCY